MQNIFLACLAIGAGVLLVQIVLSLAGVGDDLPGIDSADVTEGADLLSVRSVSAATALFGATGLWLNGMGLPPLLTVPLAGAAGLATGVASALATRQLTRLESDGSLRIDDSVGQPGTVYFPVPAHRAGFGMVQFTLQGRTVELRAVADEATEIPTGTPVIVVAVMEGDTVEVTPTPLIEGIDA